MSKKGIFSKIDDPNPIEAYGYIQKDIQLWAENTKETGPTAEPYILKTVASFDNNKRLIEWTDKTSSKFKETLPVINGVKIDIDDMTSTKDINEVDLLYNLKNRLKNKKTFTNVGPTLIIVNPFADIPNVYNDAQIEYYLEKHEKDPPELRQKITEPHLYDLVLIAIKELLKPNCKNQALIISGESGAGKTVATKNSMNCIAYFFSKFKQNENLSENSVDIIPLETKILNCNPILEGFGNAKTVRNDNSSRFGKYVMIKMNKESNIIEGAEMKTYLLEKSRITELENKERCYHIFYYLLKGADDDLLTSLHLQRDPHLYSYLWPDPSSTQVTEVSSIDDVASFKEVLSCFHSTGFSDDELKGIFSIVASVLLLGNIRVKVNNDELFFENEDVFKNVCELLGIEENSLKNALSRKYIPIQKEYGGLYEEKMIKSFIDALAKDLYNKLFLWIVTKLNSNLDAPNSIDTYKYIGLLDIFGFECFDKNNSIEQLCINYTNEQLQQLYIKDIFESDKAELKKEGLEDKLYLLDATYKDNKDVIRLIKRFFTRLRDLKEDEAIYEMVKQFELDIANPPKGDKKICKVKENKFQVPKFKAKEFTVIHTAKDVTYDARNFVEKNRDEIKEVVVDCIFNSSNQLLKLVYTNTTDTEHCKEAIKTIIKERKNASLDKILNKYLVMKFVREMKELKEELKKCDHHYVRCLKPNEDKKAFLFFPNFVFNQIQYLGILATIQVRKNGFPMRNTYIEFHENFKRIHFDFSSISVTEENSKEVTKNIIYYLLGKEEVKKYEDQFLLGHTKIFMKQTFSQMLEKKKREILDKKVEAARIIEITSYKIKYGTKLSTHISSTLNIQNYIRANREKIALAKKKDKIRQIQATYKTRVLYSEMKEKYKNTLIIQMALKTALSKKIIKEKGKLMKILDLNLNIYLYQIKKKNRIKIEKITKDLFSSFSVRLLFFLESKVSEKVIPFLQAYLASKKYSSLISEARASARKKDLTNVIGIFTKKKLICQIAKRREATEKIFRFGVCRIFGKFYEEMRRNAMIIQKYMKIMTDKNNAIAKINNEYFQNEEKKLMKANNEIIDNIFPNSKPPYQIYYEMPNSIKKNNGIIETFNSNIYNESNKKNFINSYKQTNSSFNTFTIAKTQYTNTYSNNNDIINSNVHNSIEGNTNNKTFKNNTIEINNISAPMTIDDISTIRASTTQSKKNDKINFNIKNEENKNNDNENCINTDGNEIIDVSFSRANNTAGRLLTETDYIPSSRMHKNITYNNNMINTLNNSYNTFNNNNKSIYYNKLNQEANMTQILSAKLGYLKNFKSPSLLLYSKIPNTSRINNTDIKHRIGKDNKETTKIACGLLPEYENYNQKLIKIFAKILEIDSIFDDSEYYNDNSWNKEVIRVMKKGLTSSSPIQLLIIGNTHSMALDSQGRAFSWGWNSWGQCGFPAKSTREPTVFKSFGTINKKKEGTGNNIPVLRCREKAEKVGIEGVKQIVIEDDFTLLLTNNGSVIAFGDNQNGQLGLGHTYIVNTPQILQKFKGKVKGIYSTSNENYIFTKEGELYIWSNNLKEGIITPTKIFINQNIKISSISTGNHFTILLSKCGICYGMGNNKHGELGIDPKLTQYCITPEEIIDLSKFNERITQVKCGYKHTVAVSMLGNVFTWGNNTYGQLGHKINGSNGVSKVDFGYNEENQHLTPFILQVCAGFRSSFFLSDKFTIYFCGFLNNQKRTFTPEIFEIKRKNFEASNDKEFIPVRIMASFSRARSVFYANFADVRAIREKFSNFERVRDILRILSANWLNEDIDAPFIPVIQKYFTNDFMKVKKGKK